MQFSVSEPPCLQQQSKIMFICVNIMVTMCWLQYMVIGAHVCGDVVGLTLLSVCP